MKTPEALNTYVTRYKARDGGERAVIRWKDYQQLLSMIAKRDDIILDMLDTFERLGNDQMARIDARVWHLYFSKRIKKLYANKNSTNHHRRKRRRTKAPRRKSV